MVPVESTQVYAKEMLNFLLALSVYGMKISMHEAEQAIQSCADLTDVEDVLYTMQASVCHSKKEIQTFQTVFCQRYLGYREKKPGELRDLVNQKAATEVRAATMASQVQEAHENIEKAKQRADFAKGELENLKKEKTPTASDMEVAQKKAKAADAHISLLIQRINEATRQNFYAALDRKMGSFSNYIDVNKIARPDEQQAMYSIADLANWYKKQFMEKAKWFRSRGQKDEYEAALNWAFVMRGLPSKRVGPRGAGGDLVNELARCKRAREEAEKTLERSARWKIEQEQLERDVKAAEDARRRAIAIANRLNEEQREIQDKLEMLRSRVIEKEASYNHREAFIGGHNSVHTTSQAERLLSEEIASLSKQEMAAVSQYIRTNAIAFRQTMRKRNASKSRVKIDIKQTLQKATRADGDIAKIYYEKPKKSKAKVLMLADISGSCRDVASLALTFLGLMGEVFPGGCQQFVFVDHLVPVDDFFRKAQVEAAVKQINASVQSRGVYSDYGRPIHTVATEYQGAVTKETTVIILGDCRNNKNDAAEDDFRWLCEHAHTVHLLIPESADEWGTGDSIVPLYRKCGAEAHQVTTTKELLDFLLSAGRAQR